jgi:PAS domain S-box-containing protein
MPTPVPPDLAARILEAAGDALLYASRDGIVHLWNHGAEEMFGFPAEEVVGRSMEFMIPERLRGRHWDGWNKVMETGVTRYGHDVLAVPALRRDGSSISIEFTIQLLRGADGEIEGASAILRDVTSRFEREKAMRARLKELEAKAGDAGR